MALIPQNAQAIWTFLRSHGLSANASAGILGNIYQESGGDPGAGVWPSNWGLIQWTPGSNYFAKPTTDLHTQLNAILSYINANGSIADINKHATSPSAAALYFSQTYERPAAWAANNPRRQQSAIDVLAAAISGKWPSAGTPTTGSKSGGKMATTPAPAHTSSKTTTTQQGAAAAVGQAAQQVAGAIGNLGAQTPAKQVGQAAGAVSGAANAVTSTGSKVLDWFLNALGLGALAHPQDLLKRLGLILLGGVLVVVGLIVLAWGPTKSVVEEVAKVAIP